MDKVSKENRREGRKGGGGEGREGKGRGRKKGGGNKREGKV